MQDIQKSSAMERESRGCDIEATMQDTVVTWSECLANCSKAKPNLFKPFSGMSGIARGGG